MSYFTKAEENKEYLVELRRYFHQHPELSLQEFETAKRIEQELDALGIEHRRVGETGVYGVIHGGRKGDKIIALRGDIDALAIQDEKEVGYQSQCPNKMHACGHDAHTACLLGAAKLLQESRDEFGGEVRLFFQQAEEIGAGAKVFLEEGLLDCAGRVFGIHVAPDVPVGTVAVTPGANNASVDHFIIKVTGKAAHVSTPQKGADALHIASQIVVALQAIVSRLTSPVDSIIIGVGKLTAGTAYNIVAQEAVLEGTTRTFSPETRKFVNEKIEQAAKNIAELYGAQVAFEWEDYASPLLNDAAVCAEVQQTVKDCLGEEKLVTDRGRSLGGDDFSEFLLQVPGAYAYVGSGSVDVAGSAGPAHNNLFDVDEKALPIAAGLYAQYAVQYLNG